MAKKIKQKELQVYEFIKKSIGEGVSPSIREIQNAMGYRSTSTAFHYVESLIEAGLLVKSNNLNRSIRLPNYNNTTVPVVKVVTENNPMSNLDNISGYVSYDGDKKFENPLFAVKLEGDSMINAGIFDGDILVVEQTQLAKSGDIIIAIINNDDDEDEPIVRRLYKEEDHYRLQPENNSMDAITLKNVRIAGKVVAVRRFF
ncbi:MAG: transcriptional repressor LexA [Oscillospiraceae bacterium]|nr:transcriptional repressor LexA [Oscillospiraceae bacterium]